MELFRKKTIPEEFWRSPRIHVTLVCSDDMRCPLITKWSLVSELSTKNGRITTYMSTGNTPSQHNSTLAISPLVTKRTSLHGQKNSQQQHQQLRRWCGATSTAQTPHHPVTNSPLIQKIQNPTSLATPAPPAGDGSTAGLLASMSKSGLFGPAVPSTLRKISVTRSFDGQTSAKDDSNSELNDNLEVISGATIDISTLSPAEKLRLWRHDALMQHHYRTAEYIGDKVYSITRDPNDAFWLAQVYYNNGSYIRAVELLSRDGLDTSSVMCRYLTALCLIKMEKYDDALDIVGESNPFKDVSAQHVKNQDGGIKLESSLCYLRGKIYSAQNNFEKAKQSFKEAVQVDVKNFEAFDELISNNLLTPNQEWEFLSTLDFSDLDDNEELIKSLYTTKLSKYLNLDQISEAREYLINEYNLEDNTDLIRSEIDTFFTQCKFSKCLCLCEQVLERDEFNFYVLPTYIACLYELGGKNKLFLVSHKLAENFPKSPVTWLGVGTYYLSINKVAEARKYFSKASILDPNFGQAWIGFAHTYAAEGEHEQAVSAYSTASRFFPGTHLPNLFLGMQYIVMNTLSLAEEYLTLAYDICPHDPLLLNEMGVIYFKKSDYPKAKKYFKKAWEASKKLNSDSKAWLSIHTNLGHTYRKMGDYERAIACFKIVLETSNQDTSVYCAMGLIYLKLRKIEKAIDSLHNALALQPSNQVAQDLLKQALEVNMCTVLDETHPLVVSSKINESASNYFPNSKKRDLVNQSAAKIAKRLIQGQDSSDNEAQDDVMDIE